MSILAEINRKCTTSSIAISLWEHPSNRFEELVLPNTSFEAAKITLPTSFDSKSSARRLFEKIGEFFYQCYEKHFEPLLKKILLFYFISYIVLSFAGDYKIPAVISEYGEIIQESTHENELIWQPYFVSLLKQPLGKSGYQFHGNWLGYLYAPLVLLDQKLIHGNTSLAHYEFEK